MHRNELLWKNTLFLHVAGDKGIREAMEAVALDFGLISELHVKAVVLHRIWLFPVESRVRNRDDFHILEGFADAANGDYRVGSSSPALTATVRTTDLYRIYPLDYNGKPRRYINGKPVGGAFTEPVQTVVVSTSMATLLCPPCGTIMSA